MANFSKQMFTMRKVGKDYTAAFSCLKCAGYFLKMSLETETS